MSTAVTSREFSAEERKLLDELAMAVAAQLTPRAKFLRQAAMDEIRREVVASLGARVTAIEQRLDRIERFLRRYELRAEGLNHG